jgi:hypothetical protein
MMLCKKISIESSAHSTDVKRAGRAWGKTGADFGHFLKRNAKVTVSKATF